MENTDLTEEQIQEYRDEQYACSHPESWVWSEEQVSWIAPKPWPQDGLPYLWDEEVMDWIPFPNYPTE